MTWWRGADGICGLRMSLLAFPRRGEFRRAAYALWAEAIEATQKYGTMVKSPSGYPVQSPYVSIANRQTEIMMRIASEFGFTPASRSRIAAPSEVEPSLFDPRGSA
jgi:phage terminase small subunit